MRPMLKYGLLTLLGGLLLFLSFNRHQHRNGYFEYHSELWGDKGGYYVYLPAFFIYDMDARLFPDSIEEHTGFGFQLDRQSGKVATKYPSGVALMQAPFFLLVHALAEPLGYEANGFSPIYYAMINIAAVVYLLIGLLLLYRFLKHYYQPPAAFITVSALFLGTNIFYFGLVETGMSHIYSFFLFGAFLVLSQLILHKQDNRWWVILFWTITAALIVVVRPINALFLSTFFFLDLENLTMLKQRFLWLFKRGHWVYILLSSILIIGTQFKYWHYLTGNWMYYSYGDEGFSNWSQPYILSVWLAPKNGWLIYNPLQLCTLVGLVLMWHFQKINRGFITLLLIVMTYLFASWWNWWFGCSFGSRNYVEFSTALAIPLGFFITKGLQNWRVPVYIILTLLVLYNLKLIYTFDNCWFGQSDWDWAEFSRLLFSKIK